MKKQNFTKTMLVTLLSGLGVGLLTILLRESLLKFNYNHIWEQINSLLFADITRSGNEKAIGLFFLLGQMFLRSLQILLIPLIFTSIIKAIKEIQNSTLLNKLAKNSFKNFAFILSIALIIGLVFGYSAYNLNLFKLANVEIPQANTELVSKNPLLIVLNAFQPNLISALFDNTNILAVVFISIALGLLLQANREKLETLNKLVDESNLLITKALETIILKFSPYAIFALLVNTFANYGINYLTVSINYMLVTTLALLVLIFIVFPLIVFVKVKMSPKEFLNKTYQVIAFAFATSSSAASLPLAQKTVVEKLGVDNKVASFVVPLASSINMSGTAVMQIIATIFIASIGGYQIGIVQLAMIVFLTIIGSISTPAAPGAGALLLFTIISGMNFLNAPALAAYSLILAINRPIEMLVTSANVLDDCVSATMINADLKEEIESELVIA